MEVLMLCVMCVMFWGFNFFYYVLVCSYIVLYVLCFLRLLLLFLLYFYILLLCSVAALCEN